MRVNWSYENVNVELDCESLDELVKKVVSLDRVKDLFKGGKDTEIFAALADLNNTDILKTEVCGKCGNSDVACIHREVDGNSYYELRCKQCGAKLAFGANRVGGGLYFKRKDKEGNNLGSDGWVKYNPKTGKEE